MIQTKMRASQRIGANLLIEPKHTIKPKGSDTTSVAANRSTVVPNPSRRVIVICENVMLNQ